MTPSIRSARAKRPESGSHAPRKRFAAVRRAARRTCLCPTREMTRPRAASSSYACETVTSAQSSVARQIAHRRKAIARAQPLVLDRLDELIGDLHVERPRIARIERQISAASRSYFVSSR